MLVATTNVLRFLFTTVALLLFVSCNEQEFFQKEYLQGVGVDYQSRNSDFNNQTPSTQTTTEIVAEEKEQNLVEAPEAPNEVLVEFSNSSEESVNADQEIVSNEEGGTQENIIEEDQSVDQSDDVVIVEEEQEEVNEDLNEEINEEINEENNNDQTSIDLIKQIDRFVQTAESLQKVDILWVMDNSGSMQDEQAALAENFSIFIKDFIDLKVDFQMYVTVTDPRNSNRYRYDGRKVGSSKHNLDSTYAQNDELGFIKDFEKMIQVGIRGSGDEQGLHASKRFFERYPEEIRNDAFLAVVYVSDEEDHSPLSVNSYVEYLQSLKGNAGLVKLYSIVDPTGTNGQHNDAGTRYIEASERTGGQIANIYEDFHTTLLGIGNHIINLLDSFPLTTRPHNDSFIVRVNGEVISSGFDYDADSRTITFREGFIPALGSEIEIEYDKIVE